jgi:hypothetical protein
VTPGDALLLAGNECLAYTAVSPLVQAGVVRTGLCSSLSLPSQPRGGRRLIDWLAEMLALDDTVGAVGWKWYGPDEVDDPGNRAGYPGFPGRPAATAGSAGGECDCA